MAHLFYKVPHFEVWAHIIQPTIQSTNKPITQISITNLLGQTVHNQTYNNEEVQINIASLPTGVYFVKVNGTEVKKFVKE